MIPAESLELEALMMHPRPVDVGPMYAARLVDKLWTVIRPATGEQVYTPPKFLHAYGRDQQAVEAIADNLNMGCRYIDVIMAHESTYHPDQVGEAVEREAEAREIRRAKMRVWAL